MAEYIVVTSSPMYALRAAGIQDEQPRNVGAQRRANELRHTVVSLLRYLPMRGTHATLTASACIAGTTCVSNGMSLVSRSSASSGARYGGRAGPI